MNYESICNVKHKHRGHWFDDSTMRFFKSKVYESVYCGKEFWYFVSSEKSENNPRLFTVRQFNPKTGDIDSYSSFQEFKTQAQANKAAMFAADNDK